MAKRVRQRELYKTDTESPLGVCVAGTWKAFTCTGLEHYLALCGLQETVSRALLDRMSLPIHEIRMISEETLQCMCVRAPTSGLAVGSMSWV